MNCSPLPIKKIKKQWIGKLHDRPDVIQQVLAKLGSYEHHSKIMEWLATEHNIKVHLSTILKYKMSPNYKPIIEKYREQFEAGIIEVELASKRRRLEELSELYFYAKQDGNMQEARKCLESVRYEREGNQKAGDLYQFNQYNNISDDNLRDTLETNQRVIEEINKRRGLIQVQPVENKEKKDAAN